MNFTEHLQYTESKDSVLLVRHCIAGEPTIKRETVRYLKHPNMVDPTSNQQVARYSAYIDGAEFDGYPAESERAMLGQMMEGEITIELPPALEYLVQNSDGDGMSLSGAVEVTYKNILESTYYILLAELNGLASADVDSLSVADIKQLKPIATIKHYNRESLIDWDFRRINGVKQLSLLVLVEESEHRDLEDFSRQEFKSYLVLALDEKGEYYQQKFMEKGESVERDGERVYPTVSGQRLKWIPVEIVVDEETPAGIIPARPGYLYAMCSTSLYKYRASADYKEALRHMQPTTFGSGWKDGDKELFEHLNERSYIAFGVGVANLLPNDVVMDVKGLGVESEPFERYFEMSDNKARAQGAKIDNGVAPGGDETATKSRIDNSRNTAVMRSIAKNTEAAFKRVIAYCGMYMGLWGQDAVEENLEQIEFVLPKDFGTPRMTVDEVTKSVSSSLISKAEGTRILVAAGMTISDAEEILAEIEDQGPAIGSLPYVQELKKIESGGEDDENPAPVATDDETL